MMMFTFCFLLGISLLHLSACDKIDTGNVPPYIKQCHEGDPRLLRCFIDAIHHLRPYLAEGIPEIELPSVEPFKMEELSLSLTTGPQGYKVSLKDIDVFGASNFSMKNLRLSDKNNPFEAAIHIPLLKIDSRYESSGVLIILPASGNGTFNGQLVGLDAIVRGRAVIHDKDNIKYLHVRSLNVDLKVKDVKLLVKDIYRNNIILMQAMNLFLSQNGMEVFEFMKPQLRKKLSGLFLSIANSLLSHIPLQSFYIHKE